MNQYDTSHATVSTAPKFIRDTTAYWYKPNIVRDEVSPVLQVYFRRYHGRAYIVSYCVFVSNYSRESHRTNACFLCVQALAILRPKPAGSFIVRDSRCFPGAFGLALKVDKLPTNVQLKPGGKPSPHPIYSM